MDDPKDGEDLERSGAPIGFGLERLGFLTLKAPRVSLLVFLTVLLALCLGLPRVRFDDQVSQIFSGSTDASRRYQDFTAAFPDPENDVLIVATGKAPLTAADLDALRWLHLDLAFADDVRGVLSAFSWRGPGPQPGTTAPLLPEPLPTGAAFEALRRDLLADPDIAGSFLSTDARSALIVVSLSPDIDDPAGPVADIRALAAETARASGLDIGLTGVPVIRADTAGETRRLMWLYNGIGVVIAITISMLALRSVVYSALACAPPFAGVLIVIGALGWAGLPVTMLLLVVPTLVLVIVFDDALHLAVAIRRAVEAGEDVTTAARAAVAAIGPACVLAFLTTAIALASLLPTSSTQIRGFAAVAIVATLAGIVFIFALLPPLAVVLLRGGAGTRQARVPATIRALRRASLLIVAAVTARPVAVFATGTALVVACAIGFAALSPGFRLTDQVPDLSGTRAATARVDRDFGGLNALAVVVTPPAGVGASDPRAVDVLRRIETVLGDQPDMAAVSSLTALVDLAQSSGVPLATLLREAPADIRARLIDPESGRAAVWARIPDLEARELARRIATLDGELEAVRTAAPGFAVSIEGLPVLIATQSIRMIGELRLSLLMAFVLAIGLIGAAFRSWRDGLAAVLPNLLPLMATGALLALLGDNLEFASAVSLTIGIGIAVDNTIHVLRRRELIRRPGLSPRNTLVRTYGRVGPVVVLATVVLVAGFTQALFSPLPMMRLFGLVAIVMLALALLTNVAYLPACLLLADRMRRRCLPPPG